MSLSLKAEDPKAGITALFPKDADTKPVEGEVPPSAFHEFESNMSGALARIAPTGPSLPRGTGMREMLTDPAASHPSDELKIGSFTGIPAGRIEAQKG